VPIVVPDALKRSGSFDLMLLALLRLALLVGSAEGSRSSKFTSSFLLLGELDRSGKGVMMGATAGGGNGDAPGAMGGGRKAVRAQDGGGSAGLRGELGVDLACGLSKDTMGSGKTTGGDVTTGDGNATASKMDVGAEADMAGGSSKGSGARLSPSFASIFFFFFFLVDGPSPPVTSEPPGEAGGRFTAAAVEAGAARFMGGGSTGDVGPAAGGADEEGGGGIKLEVRVLTTRGAAETAMGGGSGEETSIFDSRLLDDPSLGGNLDLISFNVLRISIIAGRASQSAATHALVKSASSLGHSGGNAEANSSMSKL
jgi:hypothetical protein